MPPPSPPPNPRPRQVDLRIWAAPAVSQPRQSPNFDFESESEFPTQRSASAIYLEQYSRFNLEEPEKLSCLQTIFVIRVTFSTH